MLQILRLEGVSCNPCLLLFLYFSASLLYTRTNLGWDVDSIMAEFLLGDFTILFFICAVRGKDKSNDLDDPMDLLHFFLPSSLSLPPADSGVYLEFRAETK